MFGPVSDTRVKHRSTNASIKFKPCNPSVLTTDGTCLCWLVEGEPAPGWYPLISRVPVSLLPWWSASSVLWHLFAVPGSQWETFLLRLCTAWCVRLWFGSYAGHNPSCAWKGPECHWFQSHAASPCGAVRMSLYETSPCRAHLHKITHETKASEKVPFQKPPVHIHSVDNAHPSDTFSARTHAHTSTEGRKRLREPSVGQMKWRNEKMHQKSDSNAFQWAHSAALYMLYTCNAKTTEVGTSTGHKNK